MDLLFRIRPKGRGNQSTAWFIISYQNTLAADDEIAIPITKRLSHSLSLVVSWKASARETSYLIGHAIFGPGTCLQSSSDRRQGKLVWVWVTFFASQLNQSTAPKKVTTCQRDPLISHFDSDVTEISSRKNRCKTSNHVCAPWKSFKGCLRS